MLVAPATNPRRTTLYIAYTMGLTTNIQGCIFLKSDSLVLPKNKWFYGKMAKTVMSLDTKVTKTPWKNNVGPK